MNKRYAYVIDNGKDTIYDLSTKGVILENFIDIEETMNNLHDENQQLTVENIVLRKQLDYIQDSISEAIKHQKTTIGQKALKQIIADYNEWIIGHK